ncbi:unnamed protein product [Paramecium pentaurelia]|uniref:Uncharacterized protein n=1 Tax=Paramecium pentaurelia TaxID=43138 RepID=A0A8S1W8N0_9CILI|nr:unnamed protein product [Paramecium pentaurelia]
MNYNKALDNGSGLPDEISDLQIISLFIIILNSMINCLSLEGLSVELIIPNFLESISIAPGFDYQGQFTVKELEKINKSQFDINWMVFNTKDSINTL